LDLGSDTGTPRGRGHHGHDQTQPKYLCRPHPYFYSLSSPGPLAGPLLDGCFSPQHQPAQDEHERRRSEQPRHPQFHAIPSAPRNQGERVGELKKSLGHVWGLLAVFCCEYPCRLLVLAVYVGLAVRAEFHVQAHRVAADRAVFDVVLVRAGRDVHRHHDFFAAGVADIGGFSVR